MISGPGTPGYPLAGIAGPGTNSGAPASAAGSINWGGVAGGAMVAGAIGNIMAGLFGYAAGQNAQETYESRARMIRAEAESEALLYKEKAQSFKASQKVKFLKAGVQLSGSPLDILDETIRVGRETASAIRARGAAGALDARMGGERAMAAGRGALVQGISGTARTIAQGAYSIYSSKEAARPRNDTPTGY